MRFLTFLNLLFYLILSLHVGFDSHVQLVCIEKNGQVALETYAVEDVLTQGPATESLLHPESSQCQGCTDIYIGNGHPDAWGYSAPSTFEPQDLQSLQQALPLHQMPCFNCFKHVIPPISQRPVFSVQESHIPSTVLLI